MRLCTVLWLFSGWFLGSGCFVTDAGLCTEDPGCESTGVSCVYPAGTDGWECDFCLDSDCDSSELGFVDGAEEVSGNCNYNGYTGDVGRARRERILNSVWYDPACNTDR